MVEPTGADMPSPGEERHQRGGMQLGGGAIASLAGAGSLGVFMSQTRTP